MLSVYSYGVTMVNSYEFEKQFRNIGIDKEQILNIGKAPEEKTAAPAAEGSAAAPGSLESEMALLRRKIEYITNSMFQRVDERFLELEQKIEAKLINQQDFKKDVMALRNEVGELRAKMGDIRIVFGDGTSAAPVLTPAASAPVPSAAPANASAPAAQPTTAAAANRPNGGMNGGAPPEEVRIDKIFDFSNKKF